MKRENLKVMSATLLVILLAILLTGCPGAYNQAPIAIISASPTEGEAPLEVSFDGSGSSDTDGSISTYEWDFGDGSATATGATQTHSYTTAGIFTVILTVTDDGGASDSSTITINTLAASIYFASDRTGNYEIYCMDDDGGNQARVTIEAWAADLWPDLLPNTRLKLAFASDRDDPGSTFDVFKSNADGTLPINLTLSTQTPYNEIEPSWSPDGAKIAFASDQTGNWEIFIMNDDGSAVTQLTTQTASVDVAPAISPDGAKIAFVSDSDGDRAIWEMEIDGGSQTKLVDSSGEDGALGPDPFGLGFGISTPSWSPDGAKLAFSSDRSGNIDIYIYDVDAGTAAAQSGASDSGYDEFSPFWLPDGDWIAFVADANSDGDHEIWKVNVDTGATVKLAEIGDNVTPAGKRE